MGTECDCGQKSGMCCYCNVTGVNMILREVLQLDERSHTPQSIHEILKIKGYKKLGSGVDQTAYLEPGTGKVLKIFGTSMYGNRKKFSKAQKMFKYWVEYCETNQSNQFLPKFEGWESFEYHGNLYLQIRMERLAKLPKSLATLLARFAAYLSYARSPQLYIDSIIDTVGQHKWGKLPRTHIGALDTSGYDELNQLMILLGKEQLLLLLNTISKLGIIGRQNGFMNDLHPGNFMHRDDGIPIIVDPWFVS